MHVLSSYFCIHEFGTIVLIVLAVSASQLALEATTAIEPGPGKPRAPTASFRVHSNLYCWEVQSDSQFEEQFDFVRNAVLLH